MFIAPSLSHGALEIKIQYKNLLLKGIAAEIAVFSWVFFLLLCNTKI
jgi:hypothetical protein